MKHLLTTALFCLTLLSQTTFAMSNEKKKEGERSILQTFQSVKAAMPDIQADTHSGPITQANIATLITNQIFIQIFTSGKNQEFLSAKNNALMQQISSMNLQKR